MSEATINPIIPAIGITMNQWLSTSSLEIRWHLRAVIYSLTQTTHKIRNVVCVHEMRCPAPQDQTKLTDLGQALFTRYVKLWVAPAPRMPGSFSPPPTSMETASKRPDMHHGTYVTHVPWYMLGSLTRGGRKTFVAFPALAQPAILHISQEAHIHRIFTYWQFRWRYPGLNTTGPYWW